MNTDYKIFAKIIMNSLNNILEEIIDKEEMCAIKWQAMWDNLRILRENLLRLKKQKLFISLVLTI